MHDVRERAPYQRYVEGLERGVLIYQRCQGCERAVFYPRTNCPVCGSLDLQFHDSRGLGTLYSSSVIFDKDQDYNVVLVDLDEGFRMMSTVIGCDVPDIGVRVKARVEHSDGMDPRLVFELAQGAQA